MAYRLWASEFGSIFWATNQTQHRSYVSGHFGTFMGDDGGGPPVYGIEGVVTAAGSPVASCVVRLYNRSTGALVDSTTTDASGLYAFTNLDPDSEKYFILAFDPAGGTQYNIGRLDLMTAGL